MERFFFFFFFLRNIKQRKITGIIPSNPTIPHCYLAKAGGGNHSSEPLGVDQCDEHLLSWALWEAAVGISVYVYGCNIHVLVYFYYIDYCFISTEFFCD